MNKEPKITIYTQVYNTKKHLRQCFDSVVNQTVPIHQYIIVDNGSTDGCSEIIKEYAQKYDFIEVVKHETNQRRFWPRVISEKATGDYLSIIDSDDWWEPDYLERMVSFLESNDLDLAVTGTEYFFQQTGKSEIMRKLEKPLVLTQKEFAVAYDRLWTFPSTNWACLFKTEIYKSFNGIEVLERVSTYGGDTAMTLEYIKRCKTIGIDNTMLYHYRQYPQSVSYNYDVQRLFSNINYYKLIKEFLESNNVLDENKQEFLKRLHLGSLYKTLETLEKSKLPAQEKFSEATRIYSDELTRFVRTKECLEKEYVESYLRAIINENIAELIGTKHEKVVLEFINEFLPKCAKAFKFELMPLFIKEDLFWDAFVRDDSDKMLDLVLDFIDTKSAYRRTYNLPQIVINLLPEGTPVSDIENEKFFNLYAGICKMVLALQNKDALEKMTEILFSGNELNCPEDFLNLYVTLAALENHIEAFLFGNIQKAYLFVDEKRFDEARQIVNDLVEMGAGESEDVIELQGLLDE